MGIDSTYTNAKAYRFSIAPMLDCTDRHFRVLIRQITRRALVYTEMIVARALQYNQGRKLLDFDKIEHPISLPVSYTHLRAHET